jgi:hypothetical protein
VPANLAATTPAATQVALTWKWTQGPGGLPIARYLVDCGTSPSALTQVGTAITTSFTWRTALPATKYYCAVVAVDSANDDSAPSAEISTTTPPMPNAPTNVLAIANSATKVTVTWTETLPPNGLQISNYDILRGLSPTTLTKVGTRTASPYTDATVVANTTYYYAIQANDSGRDVSPNSVVVSVTMPN